MHTMQKWFKHFKVSDQRNLKLCPNKSFLKVRNHKRYFKKITAAKLLLNKCAVRWIYTPCLLSMCNCFCSMVRRGRLVILNLCYAHVSLYTTFFSYGMTEKIHKWISLNKEVWWWLQFYIQMLIHSSLVLLHFRHD